MGLLSRFENKMEDGLENAADRFLDAPISPVQIAKKAEKQMRRGKMVGAGKQFAPTLFTVLVNPDDDNRLFGYYPTLAGETETYLAAKAIDDGLTMDGQPLVRFIVDDSLKHGKFEVIAELVAAPIVRELRAEEMERYGLAAPKQQAQAQYQQPQQNAPAANAYYDQYDQNGYADDYGYDQGGYADEYGYDQGGYADDYGYGQYDQYDQSGYGNQYDRGGQDAYAGQFDQGSRHGANPLDDGLLNTPLDSYSPGSSDDFLFGQNAPQSVDPGFGNQVPNASGRSMHAAPAASAASYAAPAAGAAIAGASLGAGAAAFAAQSANTSASYGQQQAQQQQQQRQQQAPYPGDIANTVMFTPQQQPRTQRAQQTAQRAFLLNRNEGRTFTLSNQGALIGRDSTCNIIVNDANASRRHAEIRKGPQGWELRDLRSTNGTFVNGGRVSSVPLYEGDRIVIGKTELVFGYR